MYQHIFEQGPRASFSALCALRYSTTRRFVLSAFPLPFATFLASFSLYIGGRGMAPAYAPRVHVRFAQDLGSATPVLLPCCFSLPSARAIWRRWFAVILQLVAAEVELSRTAQPAAITAPVFGDAMEAVSCNAAGCFCTNLSCSVFWGVLQALAGSSLAPCWPPNKSRGMARNKLRLMLAQGRRG